MRPHPAFGGHHGPSCRDTLGDAPYLEGDDESGREDEQRQEPVIFEEKHLSALVRMEIARAVRERPHEKRLKPSILRQRDATV